MSIFKRTVSTIQACRSILRSIGVRLGVRWSFGDFYQLAFGYHFGVRLPWRRLIWIVVWLITGLDHAKDLDIDARGPYSRGGAI